MLETKAVGSDLTYSSLFCPEAKSCGLAIELKLPVGGDSQDLRKLYYSINTKGKVHHMLSGLQSQSLEPLIHTFKLVDFGEMQFEQLLSFLVVTQFWRIEKSHSKSIAMAFQKKITITF